MWNCVSANPVSTVSINHGSDLLGAPCAPSKDKLEGLLRPTEATRNCHTEVNKGHMQLLWDSGWLQNLE